MADIPKWTRTIEARECDVCWRAAMWRSTALTDDPRSEYLCDGCHAALKPEAK